MAILFFVKRDPDPPLPPSKLILSAASFRFCQPIQGRWKSGLKYLLPLSYCTLARAMKSH